MEPEGGEDVTRGGGVLASIEASAELAEWLQEVKVVAAHKVLCQSNDGGHEGRLWWWWWM